MLFFRKYIFMLLLILIIFNLNGVFSIFFDIKRAFTFLYLLIATYLVFTSSNVIKIKAFQLSRSLIFFIIVYLLFATIATFINKNWDTWISSVVSILITIVIIFVITDFLLQEMIKGNLEYWFNIIVTLTFISAISGIAFNVLSLDTYGYYKAGMDRMAGVFANPNELGFVINIALGFSLMRLNGRFNIFNLSFSLLLTLASVLTYSKGSVITSVFIWSLYFLFFFYRGQLKKVIVFILFLWIMMSLRGIALDSNNNLTQQQSKRAFELLDLFSGNINDENTTGRLTIFAEAMDKIKNNPIVGYGLGSFSRLEETDRGSHNAFLLIIGEAGIFPLIYFIFIFINILTKPWRYFLDVKTKFMVLSIGLAIFMYMMSTHGVFQKRIFVLYFVIMTIYADGIFIKFLGKEGILKS